MTEIIEPLASVSTIILALLAILQIFFKLFYVDVNNVDLSISQKIGKAINRIVSVIGAFAIIIIALEVVAILYIAPRWDIVNRFQENLLTSITSKITPSLSTGQNENKPRNPIENKISTDSELFATKHFNISLSPATRTLSDINVKAIIENITNSPIFIALNKHQRPILTDDDFSFTSKHLRTDGIAWSYVEYGGREKEQRSYTQILPGKRLDIGMEFRAYPRGTPEVESKIHVTFEFITLINDTVETVSATPGTSMRYQ